jgi:hypothetical protein
MRETYCLTFSKEYSLSLLRQILGFNKGEETRGWQKLHLKIFMTFDAQQTALG